MERLTLEDAITHAKEVAEKNYRGADFESLDSVDDNIKTNCIKCAEEHIQLAEWLEELKSYKGLEEQGLLLRLPVPIGTIVYCIYTSMTGKNATILADRFTVDMCKPWGTFVFATEEEAEKKLKEMN
jgi:hypothetical protein